jgi:hypothetical protein
MSENNFNDRLASLIQGYLESTLTDPECKELEELIQKDHAIVGEVLEGLRMESLLKETVAESLEQLKQESERAKKSTRRRKSTRSFRVRRARKRKKFSLMWVSVAACLSIVAGAYIANLVLLQRSAELIRAKIIETSPNVIIHRDGKDIPAQKDMDIWVGDTIKTKQGDNTKIKYNNENTFIGISESSSVTIKEENETKLIDLEKGRVTCKVAPQTGITSFRVHTGFADAIVKGTIFSITVSDSSSRLDVEEGLVGFARKDGAYTEVTAGQYAIAGSGYDFIAKQIAESETQEIQPEPEVKEPSDFSDNFNNSPLNQWPEGWNKHEEAASRSHFRVLQQGAERFIGCVGHGAGTTQHAFIPYQEWQKDFEIIFRIRMTGKKNSRTGIEFDGKSSKTNVYSFEYSASESVLKCLYGPYEGVAQEKLRTIPLNLTLNEWHTWKISKIENKVTVSIDGKKVLEIKVPAWDKVKRSSLISRGTDTAYFDDITVSIRKP